MLAKTLVLALGALGALMLKENLIIASTLIVVATVSNFKINSK